MNGGDSFNKAVAIDTLFRVRQRGVFVYEALLWAMAGGFVLVLIGYLILLSGSVASGAEHLRRILGLSAPVFGPDWYALFIAGLVFFLPLGVLAAFFRWYKSLWNKSLKQVWREGRGAEQLASIRSIPATPGVGDREERTKYLKSLLVSDLWRPFWEDIKKDSGLKDISPESLSSDDYERTATAVWKVLQTDIKDRALATGLIVGLSGNRWIDQLTILAASLELQLHVLTRLGKKPSQHTWRTLLKRMLSSLFLNTYLTREDAFLVQFVIKKTAMGLYVLADLAEQGAEQLREIDLDQLIHSLDVDEALEGSRHVAEQTGSTLKAAGRAAATLTDVIAQAQTGVPGAGTTVINIFTEVLEGGAKVGLAITEFSLKTGATGLHLLGEFTDHYGRELMQGVAAGVMLHSHGAELAADCLALDANHRAQMTINYGESLTEMA